VLLQFVHKKEKNKKKVLLQDKDLVFVWWKRARQ
jgi:hypothetical protein